MSVYKLSIKGDVKLVDLNALYNYLEIIEVKDKLTIEFDENSSKSLDMVYDILEKSGFNIFSKEGNIGEKITLKLEIRR